jgi:nitroreductase
MQNEISPEVAAMRQADYPLDAVFLNRWSPRAFSSREVPEDVMLAAFEAARWAASSFNEQPWRFVIARSEEDRKRFLSFLMEANQVWAKDAPVLIVVCSKKTFSHNGSPNRVYQFDAGAASAYLALGATLNGLIVHGMAGFDQDGARATLGLPTDFEPIAVFALGYHGDAAQLPEEIAAREVPIGRRPVKDSIMEGRFIVPEEKQAEAETENND